MESKINYTLVGAFVLVLLAALLVIFLWLYSGDQKTYDTYLLYVHDDVTGLSVQSPVRYNGVRVGFVKDIDLDPNNPQLVRVILQIEQGTPIMVSTVATLNVQGITGLVYVSLKAGTMHAPLLKASPGQKFPIITSEDSLLTQVSNIIPQLADNFQTISKRITQLLSEKNQLAITNSLQNISTFTSTLADSSRHIQQSIASLKITLDNTSKASKALPGVMKNMETVMKSVNKAVGQISSASRAARYTMKNTQVLIQNVSSQILPSTQQVMTKLHALSSNVDQVTSELKRNPSMLVRGRLPAQPGPGEK